MTFTDPQYETPPDVEIAPPQPAQSGGRSAWHGRTASDAQGNRIMWVEPVNGRGGSWRRLSEATAPQQAREQIQTERSRLGTLTRTAPLAEEYIRIGARVPTGSWGARSLDRERQGQADTPDSLWHGFNLPTQMTPDRAGLERLAVLEDQALRGNIPQGGAQTANSAFEQQVLRGLFPSINNLGSVNRSNAASLLAERDLARNRVTEMETWLTRNPDLSQFEAHWATIQDRLRPQLVARYNQQLARLAWEERHGRTGGGAIAGRSVGGLPPAAIEELRRDPSPEARREFDEEFGAGAAARALGGR